MSLVKQTVIGLALVYAVAVPAVAEGLPQPLRVCPETSLAAA